jgi:N6-L-threonylcarbamoyladenine synthase
MEYHMNTSGDMTILGIETSCDETAAAIVVNGTDIRANVVSSQVDLHARYGGVVPEIAGRAHESLITPVVAEAMVKAGVADNEVDVVAVTHGPGLIGSLLVGVAAAKAMALVWGVPFIGINHHEAHLYASFLDQPDIEFPLVVLLVSGGHTMLIEFRNHGEYRLLGATLDDAAGEAFDKVARYLGLGYPGGPAIDQISSQGDSEAIKFTPPMFHDGLDFSFSGLKTSVINYVRKNSDADTADVAASFQMAVVNVLTHKALKAAKEVGAKGICLAGGVAANTLLRQRTSEMCNENGLIACLPSRAMCTDNAAMVAATAWWKMQNGGGSPLDLGADPNLKLPFIQN